MNVLSIDIGTSTLKSILIGSNGNVLESRDISYFDHFDVDFNNFNVDIWIFSFKKIFSIYNKFSIDVISIGGISPCIIGLDYNLDPIEVFHWNSNKKSNNFTGKSSIIPFVLYSIENNTYDKIKYFVSCFEYIIYLLTGKLFTNYPTISYLPFIFNNNELDKFGIDPNKFPELVKMGEIIGSVSSSASSKFGIKTGIKVLNSGPDYLSAFIGSGGFKEGIISNRTGTSEGFNYLSSSFLPGFSLQYPYYLDNFFIIGKILSSGYLFYLWQNSFFKDINDYDYLFNSLDSVSLEHELYFYPNKENIFSDFFKLDNDLILDLKKGLFGKLNNPLDIGLAIVEYSGFNFYNRVLQLEEYGKVISNILLSGSNSNNIVLNKFKANIIGHDLKILNFNHSELIGSAILAFVNANEFSSIEYAFNKLVKDKHIVKHDPYIHSFYKEKYKKYISNFDLFTNT